MLLQSSLIGAMEQLSPQYSSHHNLSKDETIIDPLTYQLFSPSQPISSPMTPFSIPSRPSPITPIPLSISPPPLVSPSISSSSSSTTINPIVPSKDDSSKKSTFNRSLPHSLVS